MHVNGKELISASYKPATIEGRINYRVVQNGKSKSNFKEFWFKLTGNLLFYFGLNNFGGIKGNEPVGVIVLENCSVSYDEEGSGIFAFIVTFSGDPDRHVFSCFNVNQAQAWVIALRQASYEHLRIQLKILESKLESLGGKSIFNWNNTSRTSSTNSNESASSFPIPPPRNKFVGPKTNSFVSHVVPDDSHTNNFKSDNNKGPDHDSDLIKW